MPLAANFCEWCSPPTHSYWIPHFFYFVGGAPWQGLPDAIFTSHGLRFDPGLLLILAHSVFGLQAHILTALLLTELLSCDATLRLPPRRPLTRKETNPIAPPGQATKKDCPRSRPGVHPRYCRPIGKCLAESHH